MKIEVSKFGKILTSRPSGREAAMSIRSYVKVTSKEIIELDFSDVISVGPSWLDEVLNILRKEYGKKRIVCLPTNNQSVIKSLKIIDEK